MIISDNDSNNKTEIAFDTIPVNPKIDDKGRFWLRAKPTSMKSDKTVFKEAVEACSLNVSAKAAAYLFDAVMSTAASKTAEDGIPRRIGNLIKVYPVIRGTVAGPYSAYDPTTCSCCVAISSLGGLEKTVKTENIRFVNSRPGLKVTFTEVISQGVLTEKDQIVRGKGLRALGTNTVFSSEYGDKATIQWEEDGEAKSCQITPTSQDNAGLSFAWPDSLTNVADGTSLVFVFETRGGIADAAVQTNKIGGTLVSAE